jgi:hypothetical protein
MGKIYHIYAKSQKRESLSGIVLSPNQPSNLKDILSRGLKGHSIQRAQG